MMIAHPADDSSMTDTLRMGARLLQHKFQHPRRRSEDLADWPGRGIDLRCRRQLGNHGASRAECQIFGLTAKWFRTSAEQSPPNFPQFAGRIRYLFGSEPWGKRECSVQ